MKTSRITPLLAPAAALYLAADAASATHGLNAMEWLAACLAVTLSAAALAIRRLLAAEFSGARRVGELVVGARRVGALGAFAGIGLAASLAPETGSLLRATTAAVVLPAAGALLMDLAFNLPDRVGGARARTVVSVLAVVAAVGGVAAVLPVFIVFGEPVLVPREWTQAPTLFLWTAVFGAFLLRIARRRRSTPDARAANAWATVGLIPAVAVSSWSVWFIGRGPSRIGETAMALGGAAALAVVYGHAAMIDPSRRLTASSSVRHLAARTCVLALAVASGVSLRDALPPDRWTLAVGILGWLLVLYAAWRVIEPLVEHMLAPRSGRLLRAVDDARAALRRADGLEEIAAAVLAPLRLRRSRWGRADSGSAASPRLRLFDPPMEVGIDLAGTGRSRPLTEDASALEAYVREHPGEVVIAKDLDVAIVRRPELRALAEALEALDAFSVVPMAHETDVEGCIVLADDGGGGLSLEELEALRALGRDVAVRISSVAGLGRASQRLARMAARNDELEETLEARQGEIERIRFEARALRSGRGEARQKAPPVAYSESTRALERRLAELAHADGPVLLEAEPGTALDRVARRLHEASPRHDGPFLVADLSAVAPEALGEAVFGDSEGRPGWLRLAADGTLLLADLPALPRGLQRELAESLATKQVRTADGAESYPLRARLIASSREGLLGLRAHEVIDEELARWLVPGVVRLPPLRERRDDIPSLVLLALDRSCRVLGRKPLGVTQEALEVLLAHDWPGNLRELQHVIDRAVLRSDGPKVQRDDLPPLAGAEATRVTRASHYDAGNAQPDPTSSQVARPEEAAWLEGTWLEVERQILERALSAAEGNKSEAARILDLKRTTFLDKLRRHGLHGAALKKNGKRPQSTAPAGGRASGRSAGKAAGRRRRKPAHKDSLLDDDTAAQPPER